MNASITNNTEVNEYIGVCGIYALIDPIDNTVAYVGQSKDIGRRYIQHIQTIGSERKSGWINDLIDQGYQPKLKLLEKCTQESLDEREEYWLSYHLELNEAIYNDAKKNKCNSDIRRDRKSSIYLDPCTSAAMDVLVFLNNSAGLNMSQTVNQCIWQHIAAHQRDNFDLFKVMLRKRNIDFNKELSNRV